MPEIYLDNSATTKPYPEVVNKIATVLTEYYGNPSSLHRLGRESKKEMEQARKIIADSLGVHPEEIYFTSGGTEADNLAIKGACLANGHLGNKIVTTTVEHAAVTKTIRDLKRQAWKVEYIPAPFGKLDLEAMEKAIDERTVLVSVMLVNNETGSIFPVSEVKGIIAKKNSPALLHCDAVQGYGKMKFTAGGLGVDLLSISAHKIHGPKGIGALYVKKGTKMFSLNLGGGQERGLRSGTESTPLIAGFGEAVKITFSNLDEKIAHMKNLRDCCLHKLAEQLPGAVINSPISGAPHIINLSLPGLKNRDVLQFLDSQGIYISTAAACKSNHRRGPSVLESFGLSRELAGSALRISFSHMNTKNDVEALVSSLTEYCRQHAPELLGK